MSATAVVWTSNNHGNFINVKTYTANKKTSNLRAELRDQEAKSADLNVARQFLKDNGSEALATQGSPLADLVNTLPDFNDEDADLSEMQRH